MGKAIPTVEGWHSQHMVFAMDFSAWNCFTEDEKAAARNELKAFLADLEAKHQAKEGSYAFYDCNGAKGDLILWILGPSLEYLAQVERKFRKCLSGLRRYHTAQQSRSLHHRGMGEYNPGRTGRSFHYLQKRATRRA